MTRLFSLILLPLMLFSQNNFEYVQYDTDVSTIDTFVVLHGDIFSMQTEAQDLSVTRVTHEIATGWSASFCVDIACLPPFLDIFDFNLAAGDTSLFSLDIITYNNTGTGSWTMYVVDSTSMEIDSAFIQLEVTSVGIEDFSRPEHFQISPVYPNPTNAAFRFDVSAEKSGIHSVSLYDLNGRQILVREYRLNQGQNHLTLQVQDIPSGQYFLQTEFNGERKIQKVSLVK